jgi:hypothetical protein
MIGALSYVVYVVTRYKGPFVSPGFRKVVSYALIPVEKGIRILIHTRLPWVTDKQ